MDVKDFFKNVDEDQLKEALASDNPDDMRRLAGEDGTTLTDEQLDYVAGGANCDDSSTDW